MQRTLIQAATQAMRGNHDLTILTLANELAVLKRKYARQSSQLSYFRSCEREVRIERELNSLLTDRLKEATKMPMIDFETLMDELCAQARSNVRESRERRAKRRAVRRSKHKRPSKPRTKKHVAIETTVSA